MKHVGIIGSQLLAWCAFPAVVQAYISKDASGYSLTFLLMWLAGEVMLLIYVYDKYKDIPLILNYILNLTFITILLYYKL